MMVSKGITLLAWTVMFNKDIIKWRRQITDLKTWDSYKTFFHLSHRKQRISVTTSGKGGYTVAVQSIYGVPQHPPEEHHESINHIKNIVQGVHTI